ncbi:MAG: tryptophan--tRNA ligase [Planctomycetes bacterium]|nr:tryptophan--tRNA ligase [Planctomycetota bacterium]
MRRLFSGIQPTGDIHLGNYLGAIANWVELARTHEAFFCIVDYHAITIDYEPPEMATRVGRSAAMLMAAGLGPGNCRLFVQSAVPEHTELAWVLASCTAYGALGRMTQFKDKSAQHQDNVNAGLFTYPVLQTADIALYKAQVVPVGEDQEQHLELAREVLRRFNARFGETFPEPLSARTPAARVLGLDGHAKMSKSLDNHIALAHEPEEVRRRLRGAYTDPARLTRKDPGNPDICNIYSFHGFFSPPEVRQRIARECRDATIGCADCKLLVADAMEARLGPIRARYHELVGPRSAEVGEFLRASAEEARSIARATMDEVRSRLGLFR